MYKDYKIVVNTAAGRRRYMQYLIPFVVSSSIVDRYDIWVNTHNGADIAFFKQVAAKYPVVNLVWQPDGVVNGNKSINAFYKGCVEPQTIYFKLDDDIVWMEPYLIEKMVKFRIDNPRHFLVSPLVINNSLVTYLLQVEGKLNLDKYYEAGCSHPVLWKSGYFAKELHAWFIREYLQGYRWEKLYVGKKEMGMTRFSINAILWFGDEMKKFSGVVPGDDEEYLSCIYPTRMGMTNAWNGNAVVSHFAFFTQRNQLDKSRILEEYGEACRKYFMEDGKLKAVYDNVQNAMKDVQLHQKELMRTESPYKSVAQKKTLRDKIKEHLPKSVQELLLIRYDLRRKGGFIINE